MKSKIKEIKTNKFDNSIVETKENGSSFIINCFQCQKGKVTVKWNKPRNKYSEKNNFGYYTEKDEDKEKWLCEKCIFQLYYQKKSTYWKLVPNLKKRQILRSYIYLKSLKVNK